MNAELQEKLYKKYPMIFREEDINSDPYKNGSLMAFGLEIGDGWYNILDKACKKIKKICDETGVTARAEQVKEKFGGLRMYLKVYDAAPELPPKEFVAISNKIQHILVKLEYVSMQVCEQCGSKCESVRSSCKKCSSPR